MEMAQKHILTFSLLAKRTALGSNGSVNNLSFGKRLLKNVLNWKIFRCVHSSKTANISLSQHL